MNIPNDPPHSRAGQAGGAVLSKVVTVLREQGVSLRTSSPILLTSEQEAVVPLLLGAGRSNLLSGLGEGLAEPLAPFTCGVDWQGEPAVEKVGGRETIGINFLN